MGQPITVVQRESALRGVVRFEINRSLTGMGHERYESIDAAVGERPPDVLARKLFERGGIESIHINSNVITVELEKGASAEGLVELIEGLFIYYREGVLPPSDDELIAAAG